LIADENQMVIGRTQDIVMCITRVLVVSKRKRIVALNWAREFISMKQPKGLCFFFNNVLKVLKNFNSILLKKDVNS